MLIKNEMKAFLFFLKKSLAIKYLKEFKRTKKVQTNYETYKSINHIFCSSHKN